jgi:hypothetical protein
MTIEKNHAGAWVISDTDKAGYQVTQSYYYYTKREAVALFKASRDTYWINLERRERGLAGI